MKGGKGSADYDAIEPWITGWLKTLYADCVLYKKNLPQLLIVIVNFDECGFQYKSIPQFSYVSKKQEIRAMKPIKKQGLLGSLELQPLGGSLRL